MITRATWSFFLLYVSTCSLAQKLPEYKLSGEHVDKIEHISSTKEKLKLYRKYYHKDSLKQAKVLEKQLQFKSDSLMASLQNREVQLNGTKLSKRDLRKLKKARE